MGNIFFAGGGGAPAADERPVITAEQADLAVAMAGVAAAQQAGKQGGDAAAVDALMRTHARTRLTPAGTLPMIGELAIPSVITLDVLLVIERRDQVYKDDDTATWLDLAHSALCFVDPRRAWEALGRGKEAFDLASFELAGHIGIERVKELQAQFQRAFDAFGAHAGDEPDPTPAGQSPPSD